MRLLRLPRLKTIGSVDRQEVGKINERQQNLHSMKLFKLIIRLHTRGQQLKVRQERLENVLHARPLQLVT